LKAPNTISNTPPYPGQPRTPPVRVQALTVKISRCFCETRNVLKPNLSNTRLLHPFAAPPLRNDFTIHLHPLARNASVPRPTRPRSCHRERHTRRNRRRRALTRHRRR
jgi:hypothetical protein